MKFVFQVSMMIIHRVVMVVGLLVVVVVVMLWMIFDWIFFVNRIWLGYVYFHGIWNLGQEGNYFCILEFSKIGSMKH